MPRASPFRQLRPQLTLSAEDLYFCRCYVILLLF
nr:MAG TPA: hypothetical protein [Microviridae sp.]